MQLINFPLHEAIQTQNWVWSSDRFLLIFRKLDDYMGVIGKSKWATPSSKPKMSKMSKLDEISKIQNKPLELHETENIPRVNFKAVVIAFFSKIQELKTSINQ